MPTEQIQRDLENMRRLSDARLDRIEHKIDQLSDAMISLARAEEKLINMEKTSQTLYDRMNRHSEKIDMLEDELQQCKTHRTLTNRALFVVFAATISALASHFFA